MNVTKLKQPLGKRIGTLFKMSRDDRLGWTVFVMVLVAMIVDLRGQTDKATYIVSLAIVLLLLVKLDR